MRAAKGTREVEKTWPTTRAKLRPIVWEGKPSSWDTEGSQDTLDRLLPVIVSLRSRRDDGERYYGSTCKLPSPEGDALNWNWRESNFSIFLTMGFVSIARLLGISRATVHRGTIEFGMRGQRQWLMMMNWTDTS
jgi:hypothetical protein